MAGGVAEVKSHADGIGPWKPMIVSLKVDPWKDKNADGSVYSGSTAEATTQAPTSLIADAHKAGLFVHVFTFRNEHKYLAADDEGDPQNEYPRFFRLGVDGVFTDFSRTGVAARAAFLREMGIEALVHRGEAKGRAALAPCRSRCAWRERA